MFRPLFQLIVPNVSLAKVSQIKVRISGGEKQISFLHEQSYKILFSFPNLPQGWGPMNPFSIIFILKTVVTFLWFI